MGTFKAFKEGKYVVMRVKIDTNMIQICASDYLKKGQYIDCPSDAFVLLIVQEPGEENHDKN